jgi:hypothetical protein
VVTYPPWLSILVRHPSEAGLGLTILSLPTRTRNLAS